MVQFGLLHLLRRYYCVNKSQCIAPRQKICSFLVENLTTLSPLSTQLPQAAGADFTLTLSGQGAYSIYSLSESDSSAGLSLVPALDSRRNCRLEVLMYPEEQYRSNEATSSGIGHGMKTIRVDSNVWDIYKATRKTEEITTNKRRLFIIESPTCCNSKESTSDISTKCHRYKDVEDHFLLHNPITRSRSDQEQKQCRDQEQEDAWSKYAEQNALQSNTIAEKRMKPSMDYGFTDLYSEIPEHFIREQEELSRLIGDYPDYYSTEDFSSTSSYSKISSTPPFL